MVLTQLTVSSCLSVTVCLSDCILPVSLMVLAHVREILNFCPQIERKLIFSFVNLHFEFAELSFVICLMSYVTISYYVSLNTCYFGYVEFNVNFVC